MYEICWLPSELGEWEGSREEVAAPVNAYVGLEEHTGAPAVLGSQGALWIQADRRTFSQASLTVEREVVCSHAVTWNGLSRQNRNV